MAAHSNRILLDLHRTKHVRLLMIELASASAGTMVEVVGDGEMSVTPPEKGDQQ
jgi:hypothetical protein